MTGCTDAQEASAGDSSAAPRFVFFFQSLSITGGTTSKLSPTHTKKRNLCSRILLLIAPHNTTSRHSSTVGSDSRRQPSSGRKLQRKHTSAERRRQLSSHWALELTCDMSTYDLYTSRSHPPPRTPRPSISTQQHPALTFKDVCTEAVEDEDQVLLDDHILLFSFTNSASTLHSRLSLVSFLSFCLCSSGGGLIQVNGAASDWPELHWWTLPFSREVPVYVFADPGEVNTVV